MKRVKVVVPATTSNLGPAFDCVGLALGLYNEVVAELHNSPGDTQVELTGERAPVLQQDGRNLIVKSIRTLGDLPGRLVVRCVNRIPLARGLGSSAAAVVAGLFAGRALLGIKLTDEDLLQYAAALEGHPDNAAPAVLGGAVLSIKERDHYRFFPMKVHSDLTAVVCVPDFELATEKARAAVPRTTLLENAVANVGRAMLLTQALAGGDYDALSAAMEDRLHQPYRAPLVPGFSDVIKAAQEAGVCGAALSGAGPSVLALCAKDEAERIGRAMEGAFKKHGVGSRCLTLPVESKGARIEKA